MIPNGNLPAVANYSSVVAKVRQVDKSAPDLSSQDNRNWLIHFHFNRREFGICNILIKEELDKSNGTNEYANYIQAVILRQEGKIQESLDYYQKCHRLNPRSLENIKQVARSLYLLGRHRLSLEAYNEAHVIAQTPDWEVYYNLGLCLLSLGDINKSREFVRKSVQLNRSEKCFSLLAKIHLMEGDIAGAISVYTVALDVTPDSVDIATSLGLLYMKIGENQRAFEKLGLALAHDPSSGKSLLALGAMMQNHKEFDVALSKYKLASQSIPESPGLWNNIGMCFFSKKKFVISISCLKRAQYLAPFEWKILYNLGIVHLATEQYASAFHYFSAAINLQPHNGIVFLPLAVTLTHLHDLDNARTALEQASIFTPNNPAVAVNYSLFLLKLGDTSGAAEQLQRFLQIAQRVNNIDPEMLELAEVLRQKLKIQPIVTKAELNKCEDVEVVVETQPAERKVKTQLEESQV